MATSAPQDKLSADVAQASWTETLRSFFGLLVLLVIIAAAEPLLFGAGFYSQLDFHPFWIVVLLAALQHGFALGVATVVAATLLLGVPDRIVGEDVTAYLARASVLPLRWLIVALLIGLMRQAQIREAARLVSENARLTQANERLAMEVERMDDMVIGLERQAVASSSPAPTPAQATPLALLRDGMPAVAALAGATGGELVASFETAADALLDGPAVLLLDDAEGEPLLMGNADPFASSADLTGVMGSLEPGVQTVNHTELGWLAACRVAPSVEPDHVIAVVASAKDEAGARDALASVEVLAEAALVAYDRLCRDVARESDR